MHRVRIRGYRGSREHKTRAGTGFGFCRRGSELALGLCLLELLHLLLQPLDLFIPLPQTSPCFVLITTTVHQSSECCPLTVCSLRQSVLDLTPIGSVGEGPPVLVGLHQIGIRNSLFAAGLELPRWRR